MPSSTAYQWSKDITTHSDWLKSDAERWAISTLRHAANHPGAHMPKDEKTREETHEKTRLERTRDLLRSLYQRPSSGRSSTLGRRVEKPGSGNPAGPSGQKDRAKHDLKHTNK